MARKSKTAVLKRLREVKKAEKAAMKREQKEMRREASRTGEEPLVADKDDLAGYGFPGDEEESEESEEREGG